MLRKKYRIFLWGAGEQGEAYWDKILAKKDLYVDHYLGFVDNATNKIGKIIKGIKIYAPEQVYQITFDYIVITTKHQAEIKKQLKKDWNLTDDRILLPLEYDNICFCLKQYSKYYTGEKLYKQLIATPVVYTTIIGDYDELHEPICYDRNVRYVCYTDNKRIKSKIWEMVYVKNEEMDPARFSRKIKLFPYKFMKAKSSIYIDGKFQIIGDLQDLVNRYKRDSPYLCFPHFSRNCIYEELAECLVCRKVDKIKAYSQIMKYYQEGYPFDAGLYENGFIYREHTNEIVELMEAWWKEILNHTCRDQISLPYVFWKYGFKPDITDLYIYKNKYLKYFEHKK